MASACMPYRIPTAATTPRRSSPRITNLQPLVTRSYVEVPTPELRERRPSTDSQPNPLPRHFLLPGLGCGRTFASDVTPQKDVVNPEAGKLHEGRVDRKDLLHEPRLQLFELAPGRAQIDSHPSPRVSSWREVL